MPNNEKVVSGNELELGRLLSDVGLEFGRLFSDWKLETEEDRREMELKKAEKKGVRK